MMSAECIVITLGNFTLSASTKLQSVQIVMLKCSVRRALAFAKLLVRLNDICSGKYAHVRSRMDHKIINETSD